MRANILTSIAIMRSECKGEVTRQVTAPIALYKHSSPTKESKLILLHNSQKFGIPDFGREKLTSSSEDFWLVNLGLL